MRAALQKKIDNSIKLLKSIKLDEGEAVELAYSGGKDSDVILQLAKEAGINYRAIYKNTTIDPRGTIKHVKAMGVEIRRPQKTFAELIAKKGMPHRFRRFCCKELKEYKILEKVIIGVRKAESIKRANLYREPTECRYYGAKTEKNHVVAYYPILDWDNQDILEFIIDRAITIHPLYYREDGSIDITRRLGCMCCPLQSKKKRIDDFKKNHGMIKYYLNGLREFMRTHPIRKYKNEYEYFIREVFFEKQEEYDRQQQKSLFPCETEAKKLLEDFFKIRL